MVFGQSFAYAVGDSNLRKSRTEQKVLGAVVSAAMTVQLTQA